MYQITSPERIYRPLLTSGLSTRSSLYTRTTVDSAEDGAPSLLCLATAGSGFPLNHSGPGRCGVSRTGFVFWAHTNRRGLSGSNLTTECRQPSTTPSADRAAETAKLSADGVVLGCLHSVVRLDPER